MDNPPIPDCSKRPTPETGSSFADRKFPTRVLHTQDPQNMYAIDQKGITACVTLAELITHVVKYPGEQIPMSKLRPAVEAQAEYTISLATNMLAHLGSQAIDKYTANMQELAEPGHDPDPD